MHREGFSKEGTKLRSRGMFRRRTRQSRRWISRECQPLNMCQRTSVERRGIFVKLATIYRSSLTKYWPERARALLAGARSSVVVYKI
jgi:hypothetical protein